MPKLQDYSAFFCSISIKKLFRTILNRYLENYNATVVDSHFLKGYKVSVGGAARWVLRRLLF